MNYLILSASFAPKNFDREFCLVGRAPLVSEECGQYYKFSILCLLERATKNVTED
jgi:hypothetical protein